MILPHLQDELARVARAKPVGLRAGGRALGALLAALGALLVAAPAAHGEHSPQSPAALIQRAARQ
jgi:hypothetical protein